MTRSFSEWVDVEGLDADERARLERVHDLLLAAGPPAELPQDLQRPPAQVIRFPIWRRRATLASVAAAVAVAASFVGGYVVADHGDMHVTQVVQLQGASQNELASLRVGAADDVGNNPMILTVSGLPKLGSHGYYELFTMRHGKPGFPCTGFKMHGDETTVQFTVPYELKPGTQLVIMKVQRGTHDWPGSVVMHSV